MNMYIFWFLSVIQDGMINMVIQSHVLFHPLEVPAQSESRGFPMTSQMRNSANSSLDPWG